MGHYNFAPLRVRQTAKALYDAKRTSSLPQWYDVVGNIPPGETLARPVLRAPRVKGAKKASKLFKPLPIAYPEDQLRSDFFGDHPWELARPRLVVEDSGNDAKAYDWSRIKQKGKQMDGESVVQRQLWLMKHRHMSKASAYDHARREFYHHRHLAEIRARIAKEEATHVGAYFGKGPLEVGMALEDRAWENWKAWANQQIEEEQSMRAQMFSGPQNEDAGVSALSTAEYENAVTELDPMAAATPNTSASAAPRGGVVAHP
ncbi:mitochondrial ribosomal small subunit component [Ascochyta rabiei]|uniref:37S ribosomal protein S25, mitochondrial n=1 Tax=Didymella rabiei TaxID=5454 RepID=A0A162WVL4_DIDRA|nr:mitochondrial ribosomal small subunit component [Ascochyta rabiei]KZM19229.1 structural constituent of ribosome [Ascochyta rabiei]UPX16980.1 mitochondrial ribosomal small subunit component [Ascochyta rabiei]